MSYSLRYYVFIMRVLLAIGIATIVLAGVVLARNQALSLIWPTLVGWLFGLIFTYWSLNLWHAVAETLDASQSAVAQQSAQRKLLLEHRDALNALQKRVGELALEPTEQTLPVLRESESHREKRNAGLKTAFIRNENKETLCIRCRGLVATDARECPTCGAAF